MFQPQQSCRLNGWKTCPYTQVGKKVLQKERARGFTVNYVEGALR